MGSIFIQTSMQSSLSSATSSGAERLHSAITTPLLSRRYGWFGSFRAMASPCEVHVPGADHETAERVFDVVVAETGRIEQKFSRYRPDNVIHRINTANGEPVTVDEETAGLLDYADRLFELSDGRFDITSGVLRKVWRFDGSDRVPHASDVRKILRRVGWRRASWKAPVLTLEPGMEIDLGGIGKEYAVDRAGARAREIWPRALLNFGGDLMAFGTGIDSNAWTVGIEGVTAAGLPVARIRLAFGALATSGDARRYLLKNGKRYGHILDPRTGWPVENAPRSVTVAAPTCTHAGMLATFAMLRGVDAETFLEDEGVDYWCLR
jgi:thiamine biosynthesis lipoprotein